MTQHDPQNSRPPGAHTTQIPPGYPAGGYPEPIFQTAPPNHLPPNGFENAVAPRPRGPLLLALGGVLALVVALVAGGTYWFLTNPEEQGTPVAKGMLRNTFPTTPVAAWSTTPTDVGGRSGDVFVAPDLMAGQYLTPGFVDAGGTLVTTLRSKDRLGSNASLIGLDSADGSVRWSRTISGYIDCADIPVADTLPCAVRDASDQNSRVEFVDLASGATRSTYTPAYSVGSVTTDGTSVFLAGHDRLSREPGAGLVISSGSPADPAGNWQVRPGPAAYCTLGGGDRLSLEVRQGRVFYTASSTTYVLDAATGAALGSTPMHSAVPVRPDRTAVSVCSGTTPSTAVLDGRGAVVAEHAGSMTGPDRVFTTRTDIPAFVGNTAYDAVDGRELWSVSGKLGTTSIVGDRVVTRTETGLSAYDLTDGSQLWTTGTAGSSPGGFDTTDGTVLVSHIGEGVAAYDLRDGSLAWTMPLAPSRLAPGGGNLVAMEQYSMTSFAPTGGPATLPGAIRSGNESAAGSGGELVTKCGRRPTLEPVSLRTDSGGLVVEMRIRATCPKGDVVSTNALRVTLRDKGSPVASSTFDFSGNPLALPATTGSSPDYATVRLRYPLGTFWRLPNSLGDGKGGPGSILVDCEDEGTSSGPTSAPQPGTSSPRTVDSVSSTVSGVDTERASRDALREQADADAPFVRADLADRWVPLLSSKRPGLVADGYTWNNAEILREHLELRLRFPEVRLMWSGDWSTFTEKDWWVTAAGVTFSTPEGANAWCDSKRFDAEHCFAKLISTTRPVDGSTRYRK